MLIWKYIGTIKSAVRGLYCLLFSAIVLAWVTESRAQGMSDLNVKVDSLHDQALLLMQTDRYYESLKLIYELEDIANDHDSLNFKSDYRNLLGLAYIQHYAYDKAESHFLEAIKENTKCKDTASLSINYANLVHLYVLSGKYNLYDKYYERARYFAHINGNQALYLIESECMRLYELNSNDSLVMVAGLALKRVRENYGPSVYSDRAQKDLVKLRLTLTFKMFQAFGYMENDPLDKRGYQLLNFLERQDLENILWFSPRVYEYKSQIHNYKTQYHIQKTTQNTDSILYHLGKTTFYLEKANDLLKEKSAKNNQYIISSLKREEKINLMNITSVAQAKENELVTRIVYLISFLALVAFLFLIYYLISNKRLNNANRKLNTLITNRNKFLGLVSHELRTPFYALQEFMPSLIEESGDNIAANYASIAFLDIRHLLDNSLQYSRIYYFGIEIEMYEKSVNLTDMGTNLLDYFKPIMVHHNCEVVFTGNLGHANYLMDHEKIGLVLKNILKNAIEALEVSKVNLIITSEPLCDTKDTIHFIIRDNGLGMTPEDVQKYLTKDVDFAAEASQEGIQLGITLSTMILSLYASRLEFNRIDPLAYEVSFKIDLERVPLGNENKWIYPNEHDKKDLPHILYVDDSAVNLLITKKTIETLNLHCDTVSNGYGAVQLCRENSYDLILMDLNMPGIDGFETARIILETSPAMPIIAYTALSKDEVYNKCVQHGIIDVLTKPFQKSDFVEILKSQSLYRLHN